MNSWKFCQPILPFWLSWYRVVISQIWSSSNDIRISLDIIDLKYDYRGKLHFGDIIAKIIKKNENTVFHQIEQLHEIRENFANQFFHGCLLNSHLLGLHYRQIPIPKNSQPLIGNWQLQCSENIQYILPNNFLLLYQLLLNIIIVLT